VADLVATRLDEVQGLYQRCDEDGLVVPEVQDFEEECEVAQDRWEWHR